MPDIYNCCLVKIMRFFANAQKDFDLLCLEEEGLLAD